MMVAEPLQVLAGAPLFTAEEFYATCALDHAELVNGEVVEEMPPGFDHGDIALTIGSLLRAFVRSRGLGRVSVEGGFRLKRSPDVVRSPDVSFVEASRLEGVDTRAFIDGPPTLAVEVISPGDLYSEVEDKIHEYLEAGTLFVWVVDLRTQRITVRTAESAPSIYGRGDTLRGEGVLQGFEMPLSEVFEGPSA